jgi:hypothetical protein
MTFRPRNGITLSGKPGLTAARDLRAAPWENAEGLNSLHHELGGECVQSPAEAGL